MNVLYLKYAIEVAKTGSMSKAAENLYVAQPNLSRAIKELESSLSITIFERKTNGVTVTPEGEHFLEQGRRVVRELEEMELLFGNSKTKKKPFSICVPRAAYISAAFCEFTKKIDPRIPTEIYYKETNALNVLNHVVREEYHLGIMRYADQYDDYFKILLEDKMLNYEYVANFDSLLIMSKYSKLAEMEQIPTEVLKDFIELAYADPFVPSIAKAEMRREKRTESNERQVYLFDRAGMFELLSSNPETFMWGAPLPDAALKRYELILKPCPNASRKYKDVLIYRKDYTLNAMDKQFITELCMARRKWIY